MKIALGQINTTVGDLAGNVNRMVAAARRASGLGANVVVFPELSLTGYYLQDLVPDVSIDTERSDLFDKFRRMSEQADLVVGFVGLVQIPERLLGLLLLLRGGLGVL